MKTIPEAIQRKGKTFSEWSEAEVREEYLFSARILDLLQSIEEARPQRKTRMVSLKSLLSPSHRKESRGRKLDVPITNAQLLELVKIGHDKGDKSAKETLEYYVTFWLTATGLRLTGNLKPKVSRLQKRLSDANRQFRKN